MKVKIYISDEGFGHIVRQRAIVKELYRQFESISVVIQTEVNFDFAIRNIQHDKAVRKFNNIVWHKGENSSPDTLKINEYYENYVENSEKFIKEEVENFDFDFVISDFCYEAFEIARLCGVPSFGVCHFTWDWFLGKLLSDRLNSSLIPRFLEQASSAKKLFFPPFTPPAILTDYKNHFNVPFIVKEDIAHKSWPIEDSNALKILFMDSGAGIMRNRIINVIRSFNFNNFKRKVVFGIPASIDLQQPNIFNIPHNHLIIDYVRDADFVIGRPGFNTVSECLACQVPMLLISETMNPEMEHNINALVKENIAKFLTLYDFENNFEETVQTYISSELDNYKNNLLKKNYLVNGAEVIVQSILKELK